MLIIGLVLQFYGFGQGYWVTNKEEKGLMGCWGYYQIPGTVSLFQNISGIGLVKYK